MLKLVNKDLYLLGVDGSSPFEGISSVNNAPFQHELSNSCEGGGGREIHLWKFLLAVRILQQSFLWLPMHCLHHLAEAVVNVYGSGRLHGLFSSNPETKIIVYVHTTSTMLKEHVAETNLSMEVGAYRLLSHLLFGKHGIIFLLYSLVLSENESFGN